MAIDVTDPQWGEELENKTCVLDFHAVWCGPCRAIAPILEDIEDMGIEVYKVDVDDQEALASQFGIRSVPTVLFLKGGELIETINGAVGRNKFLDAAKKLL